MGCPMTKSSSWKKRKPARDHLRKVLERGHCTWIRLVLRLVLERKRLVLARKRPVREHGKRLVLLERTRLVLRLAREHLLERKRLVLRLAREHLLERKRLVRDHLAELIT